MNAKASDATERRAHILAAATALFAEKGFYETTMNDIVAATGMSKGGLYWHFNSKDDIIAGILEQFFEQELTGLSQILTIDLPAGQRLRHLGQQIASDLEMMAASIGITLEFFALAARRDDVRATLRGYYVRYQKVLADLLGQGITTSEFRAVDADGLALTLVAQFEGLALLWSIAPDLITLATQVETMIAVLLDGISTRE